MSRPVDRPPLPWCIRCWVAPFYSPRFRTRKEARDHKRQCEDAFSELRPCCRVVYDPPRKGKR